MKAFPIPDAEGGDSRGIVSFSNDLMCPDGNVYRYVWAERWEVLTDAQIPVDKFHSAERWTLVGVVDGQVKLIIPGCGVKAWSHCPSYGHLDDRGLYILGKGCANEVTREAVLRAGEPR